MSTTCSKVNAGRTRAHGRRRTRRQGRPMRGLSAEANPVHRCAALQTTASASARIVNETRESGQSIGHRACFPQCPRQCFENCELYKFLFSLSLSLFFCLLAPSHTCAHTKWIVLSFSLTFLAIRTLKLVSVSHGLSVVPALLVADSSSPRKKSWIKFSHPYPFPIFLSKSQWVRVNERVYVYTSVQKNAVGCVSRKDVSCWVSAS